MTRMTSSYRSDVDRYDPTLTESIPFLNANASDLDVELQEINEHNEYSGSEPFEEHHAVNLREHRLEHDHLYNESPPAFLSRPQNWSSTIRTVLPRSCLGRPPRNSHSRSDSKSKSRTSRPFRLFSRILLLLLILLGLIQLLTLILGLLSSFYPSIFDHAYRTWRHNDPSLPPTSHWPTDYTADIPAIQCHSHNDYWRHVPLLSALKAGCSSVEADVWLSNNELFVGHSKSSLTPARTLRTLYIDPIIEILDRQNLLTEFQTELNTPRNGIFDTNPEKTLVLLIDFKTEYYQLWPVVVAQLEPLRRKSYLTHFNGTNVIPGPVTVVATGNAGFDFVVTNTTYRDIFFDAPLDRLANLNSSIEFDDARLEKEYLASINASPTDESNNDNQGQGHSGPQPSNPAIYSPRNSYYASVSFKQSIGSPMPYLTVAQREKIRKQIQGAHLRRLKVRYWDVPAWPVGMRNYLWRELTKMGADAVNADDLWAATKGDWRSGWSIWGWSLWGGRDW